MKIDSHQHFWDYAAAPAHYSWIDENHSALRRKFSPEQLWHLLQQSGYVGSIAVQARETLEETSYLLDLAARHPFILGVVGWLDLCAPDIEGQLAIFAANPKLRGLRMQIHDRVDTDFAASSSHVHGVSLLEHYALTYDLLLRPQHLDAAIRLVDQLPNQRFVVDHLAKPGHSDFEFWRARITAISKRPNVWCKLSGLVTEADWTSWRKDEFAKLLEVVIAAFGPARCMIGSDWPVCTLAADYRTTVQIIENHCAALSATERASICGQTCLEFYNVARPAPANPGVWHTQNHDLTPSLKPTLDKA